jgi:peptidyl-tRNA hydrolase
VSQAAHDPLRMYVVVRRGAFEDLSTAGELTGAAAVKTVCEFAGDSDLEAWRPRPGKVVLRARGGQWDELLREEDRRVVIGDAVAALPPRRRSERGALLGRMQAMTSALEPPPERPGSDAGKLTYFVNPRIEMSSGKTLAQIAHAAVMAADSGALEHWVVAGCPAIVIAPGAAAYAALAAREDCVARVVDAGLTEVPPGTVTVLALAAAR